MKVYSILLLFLSVFQLSCEETSLTADVVSNTVQHQFEVATQNVVFISGFDEGDNSYYGNARTHFRNKKMKVVEGLFSLEEIIEWLNENAAFGDFEQIHIVSHSNAWRGMSMQTVKEGDRITTASLDDAINTGMLTKVQSGITKTTQIIFHSCGLGKNTALLSSLQKAFTGTVVPKVVAANYFNVFGGKYASHYLAKPYYVFYPTAHSPGPKALAEEIKNTYPSTDLDWFTALKTRNETSLGTPYSYRFNIPVNWKISFDTSEDIPDLSSPDAIMDWIAEEDQLALAMYQLHIPLEKFRWKARVKGNVLEIKGKTTVLCVLEPVVSAEDSMEYGILDLKNESLYSSM